MNTTLLVIVTLIYFYIGVTTFPTNIGFGLMWLGYCTANIGLYFAGATQ